MQLPPKKEKGVRIGIIEIAWYREGKGNWVAQKGSERSLP